MPLSPLSEVDLKQEERQTLERGVKEGIGEKRSGGWLNRIEGRKTGSVQPFSQAMSHRDLHMPIELHMNQSKPSRMTRKTPRKNL